MRQSALPLIRFDAASGPICLGHLLSGIHNGPTLVVSTTIETGSVLISSLSGVPRISNIRGRIAVIYREQLKTLGAEGPDTLANLIGPIDDWFPAEADSHDGISSAQQATRSLTWSVLARAAELGMITGRGLIPRPDLAMPKTDADFARASAPILH